MVTLGGTISSVRSEGSEGSVPALSGADLLAGVPLPPGAEVSTEAFRLVPSTVLTREDRRELAVRIRELAASGQVDAVVVSQGTDTIEETAFALDLFDAAEAIPVVVTGAMRDTSSPSPDGTLNLSDAIATAASGASRGAGVVVVFDGLIHSARWVAKDTTYRSVGFASHPLGPIGVVTEGRPRIWLRPVETPRFRVEDVQVDAAPVALVVAAPGDPLTYLDEVATRAGGVVILGMGGGHVAASAMPTVTRLAERVPVVIASRVGSGPVLNETYGYVGSEVSLVAAGCVMAGALSAEHAAVLLDALLATGAGTDRVRETFAAFD